MIFVIILIIIAVLIIFICNIVFRYSLKCDNAWSLIDVQLNKRASLVPNLLEITKDYAKHESAILNNLINSKTNTIKEISKNSEEISASIRKIFASQEKYPELKDNLSFRNMQIEFVNIEDKISKAKKQYNNYVEDYNKVITRYPTKLIANIMHYKKKQYFGSKDSDTNPIKVQF